MTMESNDKEIDEYLSFNPSSFDFIDQLEVHQHEIIEDAYSTRYALSVEIWLSQYSSDEPHPQLRLLFEEVQELRFQQQSSPLTLRLTIRSLRQNQWEYLRYSVTDEAGKLSFYSRSFRARLINSN